MKRIAILALFLSAAAHAQWTEPVQISGFEYSLLDARLSMVGDTIHVVGSGAIKLYYLRSNDNGRTWTEPVCPADTFQGSEMPDILCAKDYIHLVAILNPFGEPRKLFHYSSNDGGVTWSPPHLITGEYGNSLKYPRLAVSGDTIFVEITTSPYLFVSVSYDNGVTWSGLHQVDYGASHVLCNPPAIFYSGGRLHLFYQLGVMEDTTGLEIYYRCSDDFVR